VEFRLHKFCWDHCVFTTLLVRKSEPVIVYFHQYHSISLQSKPALWHWTKRNPCKMYWPLTRVNYDSSCFLAGGQTSTEKRWRTTKKFSNVLKGHRKAKKKNSKESDYNNDFHSSPHSTKEDPGNKVASGCDAVWSKTDGTIQQLFLTLLVLF